MCTPMALLGFAVSAAQGVAQYGAAQSQYDIQQQMYQQNQKNAISAFQDNQVALNQNEVQQQQKAGNEIFNENLQAQAAESKALVSAGESGVSGTSVNQLIGDMQGRAGRYDDSVNTNLQWTQAQLESEKTAAGDQAVARINSVNPGTPPSFADAGIRILGGGVQALGQGLYGAPGYGPGIMSSQYNNLGP